MTDEKDCIPEHVREAAGNDIKFLEWWLIRENRIAKHNTDDHGGQEHIDKYIVTMEFEVEFSRENDGVFNVDDVEKWLRIGDMDWMTFPNRIIHVEAMQ